MHKRLELLFSIVIKALAFLSMFLLLLILAFIFKESLAVFDVVTIREFVLGREWAPLKQPPQVSILPFLLSTIYVSVIAIIFALPLGVGFSIFISCIAPVKLRRLIRPFVDMLAGIPSVIYGFIGLSVMVKFFEVRFSFSTGESIFCGGILLGIMVLPYIVSNCDEAMIKAYNKYSTYSKALGVSKWYMLANLIVPACRGSIIASLVLAIGRAMGETMAVMMVTGNSPIMPRLFSKGETIPSLIALEMGSARINSLHYHGLFASAFLLMVLLLVINTIFYIIKKKITV